MSKLELTPNLISFFDNEEKEIWMNISENKIDKLKEILKQKKADNKTELIVDELFNTEQSPSLEAHDFVTINGVNSPLYKNMVRLLIALDINGNYEHLRSIVSGKLVDVAGAIAENINKEANGYPQNSINALTWMESAGMRSALDSLGTYYRLKGENYKQTLLSILNSRTRITLSIMGHYKEAVGPDMLEIADLMEEMGNEKGAISYSKAVIADFECELSLFDEEHEQGPDETERVILNSLKEACQNVDRLEKTNQYTELCKHIDEILEREFILDDDDDEDDDENENEK